MPRTARTMALVGLILGLVASLARLVTGVRPDRAGRRILRGAHLAPRPSPTHPSAPATSPALSRVPGVLLVDDEPTDEQDPVAADGPVEADLPTWVEPVDGACPDTHPLKAKTASMIVHVPGGGSYARTRPDRCYRSLADALADGFRPAKR